MNRKVFAPILIMILALSVVTFADAEYNDKVIVLGENLSQEQRTEMLNQFNVDESVRILEVSNEEEREYLGKHIDEKLLGTRALSSVSVEKLSEGEGVTVQSNNITWVTNDMYRNALITAGISDANIMVSSPVKVSGTAALTGVIKAFEDITGEEVTEKEKEIASEEIAKTAILGNEIGQEEAEELMSNIKMYVVKNNMKNKGSIEKVAEQMADDLGITLSKEQMDQITSLMKQISKLDLDIDVIKDQLKDISGKIDNITEQNIELGSVLQRILDFVMDIFNKIFG